MQPQLLSKYSENTATSPPSTAGEVVDKPDSQISPGPKPLRVGIVFGTGMPPTALGKLLRAIRSAQVEIAAVVFEDAENHEQNNHHSSLFRLWRKLNADTPGKLSFFGSSPVLGNGEPRSRSRFAGAEDNKPLLNHLKNAGLDLVIQIGGQATLRTDLTRYGVWRIPNIFSPAEDVAWFWHMFQQKPVFEIRLLSREHQTNFVLEQRSFAAVDHLRLSRNRQTKLRKICEMLSRDLRKFSRAPQTCEAGFADPGSDLPAPGNADVVRFWFRYLCAGIPRLLRSRCFQAHWFIALGKNPGWIPSSTNEMTHFEIVTPPKDRFYADPFLIRRAGRQYLFFEDYPFAYGKGVISFVEIDAAGRCSAPQIALEQPYHLSYPCVFEHAGEVYMVPESLETHTVDLYRAVDFPQKWQLEKTLLQGVAAVDPTIFFHDGKFWLFIAGVSSEESINEELHLFYSDSLHGTWLPHKQNPIVSDVRRARPAGQLFYHEGKLVRPSQDCSSQYGRAVCFNRIDELSPNHYRETPIATIGPEWSKWNRGTHTFNQSHELQVVDGRVLIPRVRLGALLSRLKKGTTPPQCSRQDRDQIVATAYASLR